MSQGTKNLRSTGQDTEETDVHGLVCETLRMTHVVRLESGS